MSPSASALAAANATTPAACWSSLTTSPSTASRGPKRSVCRRSTTRRRIETATTNRGPCDPMGGAAVRPERAARYGATAVVMMVNRCIMEVFQRITVEAGKCAGKPCIRGHRLTVEHVLALLAEGATFDELKKDWDFLEPKDVAAALRLAASLAGERS